MFPLPANHPIPPDTSLRCSAGCKAQSPQPEAWNIGHSPWLGQWGSQSPLWTERGAESCLCPPVLSSTPGEAEDFHETPSPLALALSLPTNELVLEGCTRDQKKKQTKNPTYILTRELQPSVLLGSCGFQHPSQS